MSVATSISRIKGAGIRRFAGPEKKPKTAEEAAGMSHRGEARPLKGIINESAAGFVPVVTQRRRALIFCLIYLCFLTFHCAMQAVETDCATLAEQQFRLKQKEYRKQADESKTAWEFGRACFDLAEFATNRTQRAELAEQGIDACRKALAKASNSAPVHYYLALNLGQLARTRTFGALKLVSQMEREFSCASELEPRLDYAGPERSLGLLYRDAPSIGSIGSRTKARQRLEHAVELVPSYPDNRLSLLESFLKWGDREAARRELKALKEAWPQARLEFSGTNWNCGWHDWEERLEKAEKKLEDSSKPLESPRTKS